MNGLPALAAAVIVTSGVALWLRPWRSAGAGLPWPWLLLWLLLPLLWSPDRWSGHALWPPASGAVLSVLMCGWPLTVVAMAASALLTVADGMLTAGEVVQRWFWLGTLPATVTAVGGLLLSRWRTRRGSDAALAGVLRLLVGRAFVGTLLVAWLAVAAAASIPAAAALLLAFAEAALTTLLLAALLLWRPGWVAGFRIADRVRAR
jgi:hypothetical protein